MHLWRQSNREYDTKWQNSSDHLKNATSPIQNQWCILNNLKGCEILPHPKIIVHLESEIFFCVCSLDLNHRLWSLDWITQFYWILSDLARNKQRFDDGICISQILWSLFTSRPLLDDNNWLRSIDLNNCHKYATNQLFWITMVIEFLNPF